MKTIRIYIKKRLFFKYFFSFKNIIRERVLEDITQVIVDQLTQTHLTNDEVEKVFDKAVEKTIVIMENRKSTIEMQIEVLENKLTETINTIEYLKKKYNGRNI